MSTATPAPLARPPLPLWLGAFLAIACALIVAVPASYGILSPFSLAIFLGVGAWLALTFLTRMPAALVIAIPTLLATPMFFYSYAWELLLYLLFLLVILHGWRRRADWLFRLSGLEVALAAFTLFALFSGFWSSDARLYTIHARRVCLGFVSLWCATRMVHVASRRWFEIGLLCAALSVGLAGLARRLSSGLSVQEAAVRRPEVTNLGWGTANFLSTLLLLVAPVAFAMASESRGAKRVFAWFTFGVAALMQVVIASRAGMTLFVLGTLVQILVTGRRVRWGAAGIVVLISGLLASPMGGDFFSRFTSLRELGSMAIRVWYWREGWARLVEQLPFGLGLGQGYAQGDRLREVDPHNYWLVVGGELGLIGLALWIAVLVALWRGIDRLGANGGPRSMVIALRVAFVLAQLHTLVEPTYQGTQYQFEWFWLFGGLLAYRLYAPPDRAPAANSRL